MRESKWGTSVASWHGAYFMVIIMAIFEQYHCHDAIRYGYPTFYGLVECYN